MTVRLPEGPLELGPPRRRAVLALLLINAGKVVSISSMIRSIWETDPPDHAVATLQSYVSRLRRLIATRPLYGGAALQLEYRSPGYVLNATPDDVDVMRFERIAQQGLVAQRRGEPPEAFVLLSEALRLWAAPPFEDLVGYEFADQEAVRLDHLRLTAVETRAEAAFALGRSEEVLPELESEATRHPMRERLVYQLMRAQYRNGRQADALRRFEYTRQYLADELGADVGPELRRVHEEILRHDPSLTYLTPFRHAPGAPLGVARFAERPPTAEPVAVAGQRGTPRQSPHDDSAVFAGRRSELRRLLAAAETGHRGDGGTVLLVGEAGLGKTRLLQEFGRRLCQESGTDVITVHCPQCDDMPAYWPWTQALRRAAARRPEAVEALPDSIRRVLASLVPELAPHQGADRGADGRPQPSGAGRFELHDALSQALLALTRRPSVLVLEDFQWADAASLSLLPFLARQSAESPLLLVVTSRTFRLADDPGFRATRASVLQLHNAEEIRLGALAPQDTRQIVTAARGHDIPAELCAALHERSGGNPYFLLGLMEALPDGSTAENVRDLVPTVIREVIIQRLSALPVEVLAVLNTYAVLGPDSVHGAGEGVVSGDRVASDAARRAVRGGLLAVGGSAPERIDFVHPLVRDVVRQELTPAEPACRGVCSLAAGAIAPGPVPEAAERREHHVALRAVPSG
ncbi:BTAD domain-containing putative transcriptional regulator [Streptomyces syringium]|uniref:BTAD domain-containing putative transcriptional regulator n=1 Tax=Streptomyces syringium TaxID=76729 RepID=UPI0036EC4E5F